MGLPLSFCTFGMFIIDEIDYGEGKESSTSIIGGAGVYAALGARLTAGYPNASRVSCIIDAGSDFPPEFRLLIEQWHINAIFRTDLSRLTTRAWNGYGPNQHRAFKYLTPKRRLEVHSLSDEQALATSFHMVCSPSRCISLVKSLRARRAALNADATPPMIIWEPIPDLCTPAELENLREAATYVDVISPNGAELAEFFEAGAHKSDRPSMVAALLARCGLLPKQAVVVREGADGSRLYFQGHCLHFRAYHLDGNKVIDPTGGGNTYLGGLCQGLSREALPNFATVAQALRVSDHVESEEHIAMIMAVVHATIAASYAIEQVGMPMTDPKTVDMWNGQTYVERYMTYISREASYLSQQLLENSGAVR